MSKFDRDDTSLMEKTVRDNVEHPRVGRVAEVYEHGAADDDSNYEVDIDLTGDGESDEQYCPVISPGGNATIDIPKKHDKVLVVYTEESNKKPYAIGTAWTNRDRPPVGKAGMWRRQFDSGDTPLGKGDVYVTGYTGYDKDPTSTSKYELEPEDTLVQIAKHAGGDNIDPTEQPDLPAKVEFYESAKNDEAHITIEINMDNGAGSDATWGIKFDVKTGEVKLVDPMGYGISSDGSGNFEWYYNSLNKTSQSGGGPLSL